MSYFIYNKQVLTYLFNNIPTYSMVIMLYLFLFEVTIIFLVGGDKGMIYRAMPPMVVLNVFVGL